MKARAWSVLFTGTASGHVDAIAEWWSANRRTVPSLFLAELSTATERLSRFPGTGAPFDSRTIPGLRRVLLPSCQYHIYYTVHPIRREVVVRAVWHAARGEAPEPR